MKSPTMPNPDVLRDLLEKARINEIEGWRDAIRKKLEYLNAVSTVELHLPEPIPQGYDDPLFFDDPLFLDDPVVRQIVAKDAKTANWVERVSVARQVKAAQTLLKTLETVLKKKQHDLVPHR